MIVIANLMPSISSTSIDRVTGGMNGNILAENHEALMCMADVAESETKGLLADRETWVVFLETAVCKNSIMANTLARLLFTVKAAIESGHGDLEPAINTLRDGIEMSYLYTDEHKLAFKLYMLSLTGHLNPQDEPLTLLNGAIERGTDKIKPARKKRVPTKYERTGKRDTLKKNR
jgi:hypothetical protein